MGNTPTKVDLSRLEIKPLDSAWDRAAFCCGHQTIDNFFRNNAPEHHRKHKARVYCALYDEAVIGYYFLVAQSTPPERVSEEAFKKFGRVKETPCVYLGMLGVHEEHKGNGIGKTLMIHAMRKTMEVADIIGIYALTLEAVDEDVGNFYLGLGFKYFIEGELFMYLPLSAIREVLEAN